MSKKLFKKILVHKIHSIGKRKTSAQITMVLQLLCDHIDMANYTMYSLASIACS